jgi:hypothetical protein
VFAKAEGSIYLTCFLCCTAHNPTLAREVGQGQYWGAGEIERAEAFVHHRLEV